VLRAAAPSSANPNEREDSTNRQSLAVFRTRAHASHIARSARRNHSRKIVRHWNLSAFQHRRIQLANKQPMSSQFRATLGTTFEMIFKEQG
jgi:hypothetical protein